MSTEAITAPVVTEAPAVATDQTTTTTAETPTTDPATEPVTEAAAVEAAPDGARDTRALARIARERTALRAEQAALAQDRQQLAQVREILAEYKENPRAIEKLLGEDVLERLAAAYVPAETPKVATAEDQIAQLREEIKARDKALADQQSKQVIDTGMASLKAALEREGDTYELINSSAGHGFVFDVLVKARAEGHELSLKDAADAVEAVLEKEQGAEFDRLLTRKKFKSKWAQLPSATPATATAAALSSLTSLSTRSIAPAPDPSKRQSRQEIMAEAIAMLSG